MNREAVNHQPDLREELDECLEVLGEFVDGELVLTEAGHLLSAGNIEFATACAQVIELVQILLAENEQAWEAIGLLRRMLAEAEQGKPRVWTPGQGGSSGQRRRRPIL
jgi:hypothetical protein